MLEQFRDVVGVGHFRGPVRDGLFYWYSARQVEIDRIGGLLWSWLGDVKRDQLIAAAQAVGREASFVVNAARPLGDVAWAGGFFEGEGTIRKRGRYIGLALPQATLDGNVPEVLLRFQATIGGLGWIGGPYIAKNPWSKLPQFVWGCSRREDVTLVLTSLRPWLGARRQAEMDRALES